MNLRGHLGTTLVAVLLVGTVSGCSTPDDDSSKSRDQASAEQSVRQFLLAFDNHDANSFIGGMTESLCTSEFEMSCSKLRSNPGPVFANQPAIEVRSMAAAMIDGDHANVDLVSRVQGGLHHTFLGLVRRRDRWLVNELQLDAATPVALPTGVPVVDVTTTEFAFSVDATKLTTGVFALRVHNNGKLSHELVIKRVDTSVSLPTAAKPDLPPGVSAIPIAGIAPIDPSKSANLVLAEQLAPGHYFIFCEVSNADGTTHLHDGMAAEFTVSAPK